MNNEDVKGFRLIWRTAITVIVFFLLIATAHEYGHLTCARLLGVKASIFSVGIGPKVASWRHNEIEYAVSLLPVGAYVGFPGDNDVTSFTGSAFNNSAPHIRFIIAAAGPLTNLGLVWLSFFLFRIVGAPQRGTMISAVEPDSPAYAAGIRSGQLVAALNGKRVTTWKDIHREFTESNSDQIAIALNENGSSREVVVIAIKVNETDALTNRTYARRYLGIRPASMKTRLPFSIPQSFAYANAEFMSFIIQLRDLVFAALRGRFRAEDAVGSPILLVQLIAAFIRGKKSPFVLFPVLNLSVAIVNFLPVPLLDGGHMAFSVFQAIFPFHVGKLAAHWLTAIGMGILGGIAVHAILTDIKRIVRVRKKGCRPAIEVSSTTI